MGAETELLLTLTCSGGLPVDLTRCAGDSAARTDNLLHLCNANVAKRKHEIKRFAGFNEANHSPRDVCRQN
ncbi:MAG: hypothetical protein KDJ69_07090 [Nitratireductor sp.]|nr:hypothetical protein [Nitratireductor sp.]